MKGDANDAEPMTPTVALLNPLLLPLGHVTMS
jgi:hypothetical protein